MRKIGIKTLLGAGLVVFANTLFASAESVTSHMKVTGYTSQPIGHFEYCRNFNSDCNIISLNTTATELTRERWQQLVDVNGYSNFTIRPTSDLELYHQEEYWTYPSTQGDCEDYVLMKRKMLLDLGWPASSLLITVAKKSNGEAHAVLTVRTKKADFILDNLENKILPWYKTNYHYLKRQTANHSGYWSAISG